MSWRHALSSGVFLLLFGLSLSACAAPLTSVVRLAGEGLDQRHPIACSERYETVSRITLRRDMAAEQAVRSAFEPSRIWGVAENVRIVSAAPGAAPALAVRYPKGSIAPSSKAPRGGAGFVSQAGLGRGADAACLSYRVRFAPGFAFARGGKLPGLYGGDGPVGGAAADAGFSARLMWRRGGDGELYAYLPEAATSHGQSLGRGAWRFPVGRWVSVEEEIVLNDPAAADGIARIWIDSELRFEATDIVFRRDPEVRIEGLMFSTFFGGQDPSWASPKDQEALFADFAVHLPRGAVEDELWAALDVTHPRTVRSGN